MKLVGWLNFPPLTYVLNLLIPGRAHSPVTLRNVHPCKVLECDTWDSRIFAKTVSFNQLRPICIFLIFCMLTNMFFRNVDILHKLQNSAKHSTIRTTLLYGLLQNWNANGNSPNWITCNQIGKTWQKLIKLPARNVPKTLKFEIPLTFASKYTIRALTFQKSIKRCLLYSPPSYN